ncbi:MAG: tyrosine-type recombinase/integrase [Mycobacterium sp.]
MTALAPTLQAFFADRLAQQRQASPRTVASYRDTLRMLVIFIQGRTGKKPAALDWVDLDVETIVAFLHHLEHDRGNSIRTRNLRLTAIRGLFNYGALRHPEHAQLIAQVLAIPPKRFDKRIVEYLTDTEVQALLAAPNVSRWEGRRDRAMIALAIQTGLRVSELTGLNIGDITLGSHPMLTCTGKGRKQRAVPISAPIGAVVVTWIKEHGGAPQDPLFPTRSGRQLSRDAVAQRVNLHAATAASTCTTLQGRKLHPHVLRHTCAMTLLRGGVDTAVIALWLGHSSIRSTTPYLHADLEIKEKALAMAATPTIKPGRYRPDDTILAFLENL